MGGVADVQWVALRNADGQGIAIEYCCNEDLPANEDLKTGKAGARPAGMCGAQVSVSRWMPSEVDAARHDFELPRGEGRPVVVHVDTAHCGVGGVGGATDAVWRGHQQYFIDPITSEWNYE